MNYRCGQWTALQVFKDVLIITILNVLCLKSSYSCGSAAGVKPGQGPWHGSVCCGIHCNSEAVRFGLNRSFFFFFLNADQPFPKKKIPKHERLWEKVWSQAVNSATLSLTSALEKGLKAYLAGRSVRIKDTSCHSGEGELKATKLWAIKKDSCFLVTVFKELDRWAFSSGLRAVAWFFGLAVLFFFSVIAFPEQDCSWAGVLSDDFFYSHLALRGHQVLRCTSKLSTPLWVTVQWLSGLTLCQCLACCKIAVKCTSLAAHERGWAKCILSHINLEIRWCNLLQDELLLCWWTRYAVMTCWCVWL